MATLIKADGTKEENYKYHGLEAKQKAVGGWIEYVYTQKYVIVVNEEGRLLNEPMNVEVSALAGQMLVGDCLVMTRQEQLNEEYLD